MYIKNNIADLQRQLSDSQGKAEQLNEEKSQLVNNTTQTPNNLIIITTASSYLQSL